MTKTFLSTICALLLVATLSPAQSLNENIASVCNVAFSQGIRNNYEVLTESSQFQVYQERLCKANFKTYQSFSQSAGGLNVSVPLAEGLIGLSGSESDKSSQFSSSYDKFCHSTFFTSDSTQRYHSLVSQLSSDLTSSWKGCVDAYLETWLRSNGTFVEVSPIGDLSTFVAMVTTRNFRTGNIKIKALHPEGAVSCKHGGQAVKVGVTRIDSKQFALTCSKNPILSIPFVLETSDGTSQVVTVPEVASKIAELTAQIRALQAQVLSQQADVQKVAIDLNHFQNILHTRINGIKLEEAASYALPEFACGGAAVATQGFTYMVGTKDGSGCGIQNINYVRRLSLSIPP